VGGGELNTASGTQSTVAGGYVNAASGYQAAVGGGFANHAAGKASSIAGGSQNSADGDYSFVSGQRNGARGEASMAPGGFDNAAGGDFSFAAGFRAEVRDASRTGDDDGDEGTFIGADASDSLSFDSTGPNQFLIRAVGGVGINTNRPENTLHVFKGSAGSVSGHANAPLVVENDENVYLNILSPDANERGVLFGEPTDGNAAGGIVYNSTKTPDGLQFRVNGNKTAMAIGSAGFVGIGTTSPDTPLDVKRSKGAVAAFDRLDDDGVVVSIQQDGVTEGVISVSGSTVSYGNFTGSHFAWSDESFERGALVRMTGENRWFHDRPGAELIYGITPTARANDPACLGAYLSLLNPSEPADAENPHLVMPVGNGDMWIVDDGRGDIRAGDSLIASDVPGCAMLDDAERFPIGHIVARAAEPVEWDQIDPGDDGIPRTRISVLFGNFDRHGAATRLERIVEQQAREIAALRSRLERMENTSSTAKTVEAIP
jgi:hypothetical protein